jgi:indolepyruvate ferredoxin oxidoreductase beta subunit
MSRVEQRLPKRSGWRTVIAGTGGQGVITAARLLTEFAVRQGHQALSSQLHGMAQRGGAVQSAVMIDCGISPAIGRAGADFVLGLEPVETARALPLMTARTVVFMNTIPVIPYVLAQNYVLDEGTVDYPSLEELSASIREVTPRLVTLDASALAKGAGSIRALNVVMLGCLFGSGLLPYSGEHFMKSVMTNAPPRLAETNSRAFLSGVEFGESLDLSEECQCL